MPEIFFGGARGGGKTDGVLGKYALKAGTYGSGFNALFCRRELPMLDDAIERSKDIYAPVGAKFNDQKKEWRFPGGGRIRFRPLERVDDAAKYQGQNVSDACIEEAGLYPDPKPIDRLNGVLRSAHGVPTQLILTGNPGGPGQGWIKQRYIDPEPRGMKILRRKIGGKGNFAFEHRYVFIPSKLQDNRLLMASDPNYIVRLHLVGSDQLVKAWLEGDWNAIEGAFFDHWSQRNIIDPIPIPRDWKRFRSGDWGFAKPFSIGWWAIVGDDTPVRSGLVLPRGALLRYLEWYGCQRDQPNVGLRLTAEEVGQGIKQREADEPDPITYGVMDPAAFAEDGGPSIAERIGTAGKVWFQRADNKRVAAAGALGGWDMMRHRIKGEEPERPMIACFSTCLASIRTIPALQHDADRPEDLDTDGEDHAADEWRYACMSRPWMPPLPDARKPKNPSGYTRRDDGDLHSNDWITA